MEVIEVPPYVSDEEEDMNASVQVERKKQAKKKKHTWMKEMVFKNADEAEQAVINEGQWSEYYTNTTAYREKKIFRCNQVKRRGKQCDAGIYCGGQLNFPPTFFYLFVIIIFSFSNPLYIERKPGTRCIFWYIYIKHQMQFNV